MNVGINILHNFLKIICPFDKNILFEEKEYLNNIICMWYLGFRTVHFFCSSRSLFKKNCILKRSSFKNNVGTLKKKNSNICDNHCQLLDKKYNRSYMDQNEFSSAEMLYNTNDVSKEQCSSILSYADGGSFRASNSIKKVRKHPNYFVAVQITDPEVHFSVKTIQDHISSQDDCFEKYLISRNTLHVTLEVVHLKDSEDHSRALKALNTVHKKYNYIMCKEPLQLEFTGVGHFGNRVLYAKIKENSSYGRLCDLAESIGQQLEAVGINISNSKKKFYPHLTIAKLTYVKKHSKTVRKIPPSLYQEFLDFHFGCDIVKSIQLLKMAGPKTSSGYYMGEELFFCLKEPMFWKNLNSLLAIAEKKRDIRKKISTLAGKLLK